MKKLLFIPILILYPWAVGQTPTRTAPDCSLSFSFTSTGSSANLDNIPQIASGNSVGGCVAWVVEADAFNSGAGTLVFQASSASNAAGTGPSSFSTFGGTVVSGATSSSSFPWTFIGGPNYYPWLRVTATVLSAGTLRGTISGWRNPSAASAGSGGSGSTTIVNFTTCNNGSNTLTRSAFTFTASGNTQIVAASGSTTVTVCGIYATTDSVTFLKLTRGTGSNCGTGTADLTSYPTGSSYNELGFVIDFPLPSTASNAVCINSAAAVNGGGTILYVQQ